MLILLSQLDIIKTNKVPILILTLISKLRIEKAKQENQQILKALEFYENNASLKNLFFQHQGKKIQFQDAYGRNQEIRIQSVADIFTVIVHSFKTN